MVTITSLNNELYTTKNIECRLEKRLGTTHARQRLAIENDHHQDVFTHAGKFFHLENWYSVHSLISSCIRLVGLYDRGQKNTTKIQVRENQFSLINLPTSFDGFRILHLSDMHVDMSSQNIHALIELLRSVDYDVCVMTGDYRAKTFGDIDETLRILNTIRLHLKDPVYAVLGNHDSIRMVPMMEDMGIQLLLNEATAINRGEEKIYLAGIDDAHFYHMDNIEEATASITGDNVKILLSHTPEVYKQAARAAYDVFLCGHTHGGQICLPGGTPILLDADCPRQFGKGRWQYHDMQGYTSSGSGASIVNIRINCPPEITLHTLQKS